MKRYVTGVCVFTSILIFLICICVLTCSAKMTSYLVKKQDSIIVTRGAEGIDNTKKAILNDFADKVYEASREAYDTLSKIIYDDRANITEEEANELYRKIALKKLKDKYEISSTYEEEESKQLAKSLSELLPELRIGEMAIDSDTSPYLELNGNIIYLKNVNASFTYGNAYFRDESFDAHAELDDITMYDENEDLFEYCMVADKGIYITGDTSTLIGDIYAGTHSPTELRKAEALYGESEYYGGVNIMSTQIAIEADKIITDGNVNLKGAFTVFGSENRPVDLCAKNIIENDNIASKNIYALFGELSDRDISEEQMMAREAMRYFGSIEHYYDTENDKSYRGKYRKIISSTDVTVTGDVTGVIITPGNVIVEEGVNIEGLILSGDRIYVQGNNNIVSSVEILREIIREELYEDIYAEETYETDEERALNSIHLMMKDYVGGIKSRGFGENL